jgi:pimeloyl-ACP methyl ester carboxylesterase
MREGWAAAVRSSRWIHRASSRASRPGRLVSGVTIVGTVHGQGPPLVFLPGGIGEGDLDWQALLPHLTGTFTCCLPSLRGRGLSGDSSDLRLHRLVEDLVDYVDSIGQSSGLVGWSADGMALSVGRSPTQ